MISVGNDVDLSVIIPAANNQDTILRAITSLNSMDIEFEIIIILNNSQDNTAAIVQGVATRESRIKVFYSKPGRSLARNTGLRKARGNFIFFLDADDEASVDFIQNGVRVLEASPEIRAVYSNTYIRDDRQDSLDLYVVRQSSVDKLFIRNPFLIESVLFRNDGLQIKFDETLSYCEDWWFWVTNFNSADFKRISGVSGTVHVSGNNSMSNFDQVTYFELYIRLRIIRKFHVRSIKSLVPDLKLVVKYFQCSQKHLKGLWDTMPLIATIGLVLTKAPFLSKISRSILYKSKLFNTYR